MRRIHDVLARLRAEFLEMPGLRLRTEQVQRLCGIEPRVCQLVLDELVDAKFLCVTSGGLYVPLDGWRGSSSASSKGRPQGRQSFLEGLVIPPERSRMVRQEVRSTPDGFRLIDHDDGVNYEILGAAALTDGLAAIASEIAIREHDVLNSHHTICSSLRTAFTMTANFARADRALLQRPRHFSHPA